MAYASRKPVVMRGVDQHKHGAQPAPGGQRPAHGAATDGRAAPVPAAARAAAARSRWRNPDRLRLFSHPDRPSALRIQIPTAAPAPPPPNQEDRIGRDDRSALVCCHEPSYLEYLTGQLRAIGYKVHHATGHQAAIGGCRRVRTT